MVVAQAPYCMNSNGTKLEQVVHTHQKSCLSGWSTGFGELDPIPQWIPVLAPIYPLPLRFEYPFALF